MNKIKINQDSLIYVLSPAFFKTGGTELLHQYAYVLKSQGFNSFIVYDDATEEKNINPAFNKYVSEYKNLEDIEDNENNIIVIPEVFTHYVRRFKHAQIVIWWESVDNYLKFISIKYHLERLDQNLKNHVWFILNILKGTFKAAKYKSLRNDVKYHFVQSEYAEDFLLRNKIGNKDNIFYVSDYINDLYLDKHPKTYEQKEDFVCYNPAKGKAFTSKIIKRCPNIKFVPLVNMTNEQVFETLSKAKVYIDFGDHPGKDRFPREAAIMGCVVLTNKKGAAKFYKDIPIKDEYKFKHKTSSIKKIKLKLEDVLSNYQSRINDFESYQKMILGEKEVFIDNVINCYEK